MTGDDIGMINLCCQLKSVGIDIDVARISNKRHSNEWLDEIKSTLQNLLQLLRGDGDYHFQDYDDGKMKYQDTRLNHYIDAKNAQPSFHHSDRCLEASKGNGAQGNSHVITVWVVIEVK